MLNDFYRARWDIFYKALEEGKNITSPEWFQWEDRWSRSKTITQIPKEAPISVAEELFNKYFKTH
jgi:hypothetical protein